MLELPPEILNASPHGAAARQWFAIIGERLASALTLADEIHALVAPLAARDQWFILGTWSYFHQTAPTMQAMIDALPPSSRVSRQRVAQIVQRQHSWLTRSALRPRLLNSAVAVLRDNGGTLPLPSWMEALEKEGINASVAAIRTLPSLCELGLVADVSYHPWSDLWSARSPHDDRDAEDVAWVAELRRVGRAALRLQGAIPRSDIDAIARYGQEHALGLIDPSANDWEDVQGYLVPSPQGRSRLSQLARKVLSVSSPVHIRWISRGVARSTQQPIRIPVEVVRAVLARHPEFQVRGKRVRSRSPLTPQQALTRLESAFVELITSRGGTVTAGGVSEWLRNHNVTAGFTGHLCRAPFVRRISRGVYELVGREVPFSRRLRPMDRAAEQSPLVGSPLWEGEWRCVVQYRLEAVEATGGLWLPAELAFALALTSDRWGAILPDGRYTPLQLINRHLIGLREWIRSERQQFADTLTVHFDLSENHVYLYPDAKLHS
jgi:hypothetical protein